MNNIPVLRELREQYNKLIDERNDKVKEIEQQYNIKLKEISSAYNVCLELNTACMWCEGKGYYDVTDDDCYDSHYHKERCLCCNGTGEITKK